MFHVFSSREEISRVASQKLFSLNCFSQGDAFSIFNLLSHVGMFVKIDFDSSATVFGAERVLILCRSISLVLALHDNSLFSIL